eukprot:gene4917-6751_t
MSAAQQICIRDTYSQPAASRGPMGCASALVFANLGAAYGTATVGLGVAHLSLVNSQLIMRGIVPVVMAGILGIYGLIVAVIIQSNIKTNAHEYPSASGYVHFGAGLAAGLSALAAGPAIGIVDGTSAAYGKHAVFFAMNLM